MSRPVGRPQAAGAAAATDNRLSACCVAVGWDCADARAAPLRCNQPLSRRSFDAAAAALPAVEPLEPLEPLEPVPAPKSPVALGVVDPSTLPAGPPVAPDRVFASPGLLLPVVEALVPVPAPKSPVALGVVDPSTLPAGPPGVPDRVFASPGLVLPAAESLEPVPAPVEPVPAPCALTETAAAERNRAVAPPMTTCLANDRCRTAFMVTSLMESIIQRNAGPSQKRQLECLLSGSSQSLLISCPSAWASRSSLARRPSNFCRLPFSWNRYSVANAAVWWNGARP